MKSLIHKPLSLITKTRIRGLDAFSCDGRRYGVGARTVTPQRITVTRLTVFYSILTTQNSNFYMETWNLAKIEVVEEEKIYNFGFGQKLIWGLD